ncbi:MAG TPA: hypothetical protein VJ753_05625 [Rhizomicrobium sp.]|nr:hypothetical protein [Rhizomicrobium sp.]
MKHSASNSFWSAYEKLPTHIRALADKNFMLLKKNPQHPSLHFKKAGGYWSARIGLDYRALAKEVEGGLLWGWIGTHAEYDRRIKAL